MKSSGVGNQKKRQMSLHQAHQHHQSHTSLNSNNSRNIIINHNSAPIDRRLREQRFKNSTASISTSPKPVQEETRTLRSSTPQSLLAAEDDFEIRRLIILRSRRLSICLICLLASISCLTPFVSLHLTQRVGLLLFESDLVQFRSSLFSVIICIIVLVILHSIIVLFLNGKNDHKQLTTFRSSTRKSWIIQRTFKQLITLFASISAIAYLALVLLVPQIRQIQRMPLATFDCNANLITIENCHQQFSVKGGELSVGRAFKQLLADDLNSSGKNSERLVKKLNCLNYNDKELKTLQVPTRFLLHKCGLVCKPQRQQLHQFGDDLNKEQLYRHQHSSSGSEKPDQPKESNNDNRNQPNRLLVPPYNTEFNTRENPDNNSRHIIYHNSTSSSVEQSQDVTTSTTQNTDDSTSSVNQQVSLRVCFSGEFSGGSNYKQFCVTNLAFHRLRSQEHTLTVGQLNAMLRRFIPESPTDNQDLQDPLFNNAADGVEAHHHRIRNSHRMRDKDNQNTHYINPVVQFESHFKNWPHLPFESDSNDELSGEESWCKFRPIPPFIVNNKPFSDIQCSLEHEYTMTTGPPQPIESAVGGAERIYLKKSQSTADDAQDTGSVARERCNIQCKVNILYQVHMDTKNKSPSNGRPSGLKEKPQLNDFDEETEKTNIDDTPSDGLHYYLPLKPCVLMTGDGDKSKTIDYYLIFRSIGDGTIILVFILIDLFLLIESIDTKQFQLEAKKVRLIAPLVAIALIPLIVALLFDLIPHWYPYYYTSSANQKGRKEGYFITFLNERIIPSLSQIFATTASTSPSTIKKKTGNITASTTPFVGLVDNPFDKRISSNSSLIIDNFMLPFFFYSIFMFILAINSLAIPLFTSSAPLMRSSSTEELGMSPCSNTKKQTSSIIGSKTGKQKVKTIHNQQEHDQQSEKQQQRKLVKKLLFKLISLHLIALFMGTQFNLSQITQTQILIESFGNPGLTNGSSYLALWFIFVTHSGAVIFILLLTLLFIDEISTFLSNFSPFKSSVTGVFTSTSEQINKSKAKFLQYLTVSILIYATRCFAISNLVSESRFKWLVVFLFQVAEFFNFPVTWFALTNWGHEIITDHQVKENFMRPKPQQAANQQEKLDSKSNSNSNVQTTRDFKQTPASGSKALDFHLAIQSSLALTYFAIARSIALLFHSLYASLHLHNDNVDWFITSFYKNPSDLAAASNPKQTAVNLSSPLINNQPTPGLNINSSGGGNNGGSGKPAESLFSPLPGERQTYLYASRLFLKYNSLLCLLVGIILLLTLLYVKYQIWAENKRTLDIFHRANNRGNGSPLDESGEYIDEQLSLDLMRLHQYPNTTSTKTIYPEPATRKSSESLRDSDTNLARRVDSPSAKILFRYNLDRDLNSSDSSSSSNIPRHHDKLNIKSPQKSNKPSDKHQHHKPELTIPMALEELDQDEDLKSEEEYFSEREIKDREDAAHDQFTERIVSHKSKKVRIFEDGESWPEPEHDEDNQVYESEIGDGLAEEELNNIIVPEQFVEDQPQQSERTTKTTTYSHKRRELIESKKEQKTTIDRQTSAIKAPYLAGKSSTNEQPTKKRSISFAPITTYIGEDEFSKQHRSMTTNHHQQQKDEDSRTNSATSSSTIRHASPDPSIGEFDDDDDDGADSIE